MFCKLQNSYILQVKMKTPELMWSQAMTWNDKDLFSFLRLQFHDFFHGDVLLLKFDCWYVQVLNQAEAFQPLIVETLAV